MNPYRKWIDPGGRILSNRLDRLRATFEDLASRLRSTIAAAVGSALGDVIRDTVLGTLNRLGGSAQTVERPILPNRREPWQSPYDRDREEDSRGWPDRQPPREERLWFEERSYEEDEPEADDEPRNEQPAPPVSVIAVAAGLQFSAWWLRRWTGDRRLLTTLAVGLVTGGLAFTMPALAGSVLNLAGSAFHLSNLGNTLSSFGPS